MAGTFDTSFDWLHRLERETLRSFLDCRETLRKKDKLMIQHLDTSANTRTGLLTKYVMIENPADRLVYVFIFIFMKLEIKVLGGCP